MCAEYGLSCFSRVRLFATLYRLSPARLLCPWDSPGESTGVGCHVLLQGIFPAQRSNPGSLVSPALANRGFFCCCYCKCHLGSLVAQMVKNLSAKISWRREWLPTPVLLSGEFHGQRAWWAIVHGVAKS